MKKFTLSLVLMGLAIVCLKAQTFTDEKTLSFDAAPIDLVRLHNKNGKVTVKGTNGNEVILKVKRKLSSSSTSKLESAKTGIYFDSTIEDGTLIFFIQTPDYRLEINENGQAHYTNRSGNWNSSDNVFYKVKAEFTIELLIPSTTPLIASTHENNLIISGMKADLLAHNHHGKLDLKNIGGNVEAHTHHGNIDIDYSKNPTKDANFTTHHGSIQLQLQPNFAADVIMSSKHGNFFTDFNYEAMPMKINSKREKNHKGTKYKLGGGSAIRIGNGGPELNFKTYHGSIYLLK